jgi:8-oxo-dGTP diphosphatase
MKSIRVVCAIIEQNGEILAAKRSTCQPHGGCWEFPGGKINEDEEPKSAIVREIREELGADIKVLRVLDAVTHDYPDKRITLMPFVCRVENGELTALEHEELRFVDKKEAARLPWLPPDRLILEQYLLTVS